MRTPVKMKIEPIFERLALLGIHVQTGMDFKEWERVFPCGG